MPKNAPEKYTTEDWKKMILAIDDPKALEFIKDVISARISLGDAEARLSEVGKEDPKDNQTIGQIKKLKKFKPLKLENNPDEELEEGY